MVMLLAEGFPSAELTEPGNGPERNDAKKMTIEKIHANRCFEEP